MRRTLSIGGVVLAIALLAVVLFSLVGTPAASPVAPEQPTDDERDLVVRFDDHESGIWPWLSASRSFQQRSPINVVVLGDADRVIRVLQESGEFRADDGEPGWEETPADEREAREGDYSVRDLEFNGTEIAWGRTGGGARYAYVERSPGDGEWVRETTHLHDGEYYGHRVHMRLYESPREDEDWVAIQAHSEHFDWFTLRHAVDGVQEAQVHVERDLVAHPQVDQDDVLRRQLGNGGVSDSDGWATVVAFALLWPLGLLGSAKLERIWNSRLTPVDRRRLRTLRDRWSVRQTVLALAIVGLLLGVRVLGIALERHVEALSMHQIAGLLYPLIAVGVPIATYLLATGIERRMDAAVTAAVSMTAAILLDFSAVGVGVIPIDILLHRLGVVLGIGLLAGGAARRATRETHLNGLAVTGLLLWVALLLATLFQYV